MISIRKAEKSRKEFRKVKIRSGKRKIMVKKEERDIEKRGKCR